MTLELNMIDLTSIFFLTRENEENHHEHYIITVIDHAYFEKKKSFKMNRKAFNDFK